MTRDGYCNGLGLSNPAWSPDGGRLLVVDRSDDCQILSVEVNEPSTVASLYDCAEGERLEPGAAAQRRNVDLQPSPSTVRLALDSPPLRSRHAARAHSSRFPQSPGQGDIFLALSPDREKVAVIRDVDRARLEAADSRLGFGNEEKWSMVSPTPPGRFPGLRTRGLSSSPMETGLHRFSLEGGTTERLIPSLRDLRQPSVSPVGNRVAVVDQSLHALTS